MERVGEGAGRPLPASPVAFLFVCSGACRLFCGPHGPVTHGVQLPDTLLTPAPQSPGPPVRGKCLESLQAEGPEVTGSHRGATQNPSLPSGAHRPLPRPAPSLPGCWSPLRMSLFGFYIWIPEVTRESREGWGGACGNELQLAAVWGKGPSSS